MISKSVKNPTTTKRHWLVLQAHTFTPKGNSAQPVHLPTCIFGGNQRTQREPEHMKKGIHSFLQVHILSLHNVLYSELRLFTHRGEKLGSSEQQQEPSIVVGPGFAHISSSPSKHWSKVASTSSCPVETAVHDVWRPFEQVHGEQSDIYMSTKGTIETIPTNLGA